MKQYNLILNDEQLFVLRMILLYTKQHTTGQTAKDRAVGLELMNLVSSVQSIDTPEWQKTVGG